MPQHEPWLHVVITFREKQLTVKKPIKRARFMMIYAVLILSSHACHLHVYTEWIGVLKEKIVCDHVSKLYHDACVPWSRLKSEQTIGLLVFPNF